MNERVVTVRFHRDGERGGLPLDKDRKYLAIVDGGPPSEFRSPWSQEELEEHIECLRNVDVDAKPTIERIKEIGKQLGEAIFSIKGFSKALASEGPVTVYWQLDYPELARLPWELETYDQEPYHHILMGNISFVRKVPALIHDAPARWPTGRNQALRLLYAWGEEAGKDVPHRKHREILENLCDKYGIDLVSREIPDIKTLTELVCSERFHFVHLLAHGKLAGNREWGLLLSKSVVTGEQVARALVSSGTTPALVTVAACDSANDRDTSFGSVAYQLHVYGIPLVMASQFRLREQVSLTSVGTIYEELFSQGDSRGILKSLRRQLAPADDESWADEVLYSRYRQESLEELITIAKQQAALRRARSIEQKAKNGELDKYQAVNALKEEKNKLKELAATLESTEPRNPEHLAETYGLLGSLQQRIAKLLNDPPNLEDLRAARAFYEQGIRADANSHYCGINVVHLSLRVGEKKTMEDFVPLTRFSAENAAKQGDFWAFATLGDLEVYEGHSAEAAQRYRECVGEAEKGNKDPDRLIKDFETSRRPLPEIVEIFNGPEFTKVREAAQAAMKVLDAAIQRQQP